MLQNPKASVAIAHDDDVAAIIKVRYHLQVLVWLRLIYPPGQKNDFLDFGTLVSEVAPPVVVDSDGGSSKTFMMAHIGMTWSLVGTISLDVSSQNQVEENGAYDPHPSESWKASQLLKESESEHKLLFVQSWTHYGISSWLVKHLETRQLPISSGLKKNSATRFYPICR
jgi:hypothetical protein